MVDCAYDIRIGGPGGTLFASGEQGNISDATGNWVTDGMMFYLQARGDSSPAGTLGIVTAKLQPSAPVACSIKGFAAGPNPIRTNDAFGARTFTGTADCAYDIRLGGPGGKLFASGERGTISATTGNWVTDGTMFYLQARGDTSATGTLALVTAQVQTTTGAMPCPVAGFATDVSPILTNDPFGVTTLTGTAGCPYDIRVGSPDGTLFAHGEKGVISAKTGAWVTDGLAFYLQASGDTTSAGTLAITSAKLQTAAPSCAVEGFTATPFNGGAQYGRTTLLGSVDCAYDIRVGSPGGPLFTTGNAGAINATTGNWVTDGLAFFLQTQGSTTEGGTLAVAKAAAMSL
jgi:hypothetical protein